MYEGRRQDLAFELPVGHSASRRHHVRLWLTLASGAEGREVWLGAVSFDRSVGLSHDTGQITHHIDPDLDAEREFFIGSLSRAGTLSKIYQVSGVEPTLNGRNGGGDHYFTDGELFFGVLRPTVDASAPAPVTLPGPAAITIKGRLWAALVRAGRFVHLLPRPRR